MSRHGPLGHLDGPEPQRAAHRLTALRRLLGELGAYRVQLAWALGLILLGAGAQGLGPFLVGRAIDHDILGADRAGLLRTLAELTAVYVVGVLAQRAQMRRVGVVGQRLLAGLRARLFARLQSLPLAWFDRHPLGDLMSRLLADVDTLGQLFSQGLVQLLGSLLGLTGVLVAMVSLHPRLALACFAVIPVIAGTTWLFAARARVAYRRARQTVGDVTAELHEEIAGVRQAQAFNRTELNIARFRVRNAANRDANIAAVGVSSAFGPTIDLLSTLAMAEVIGYGGYLVLQGQLTVGVLAAFLIYVQQFFRPVQLAASVYTLLQSALAGAERVYAILDEPPELPDPPDAREPGELAGRIEFEDVSFGYDPDRPVLQQITFTAEPGWTVALVGPTGAGKTTLASLIPRLYDVSGGTVRLDGHDVRRLRRASLRRQMTMIVQEPFLFSATIGENIAFGAPSASAAQIEAAARAVHAHEFIAALPDGYATAVGEGGGTLSLGQRQLLAFARAVLVNPKLLILDEATASVDTLTEARLQQALATLLAGRTSVVIAHRLATVRHAQLILVLDRGRIVERGTHEELLAQGGLYARLAAGQLG